MAMTSLIGFAVVLTLLGMLVAAGWVYSVLDRMLTRGRGQGQAACAGRQAAAQCGGSVRSPSGCRLGSTHGSGARGPCCGVLRGRGSRSAGPAGSSESLVRELALSPAATWFQRNAAYVSINSGLGVRDVKPGFLVSTARLADGSVLVGLPGTQKWYRL